MTRFATQQALATPIQSDAQLAQLCSERDAARAALDAARADIVRLCDALADVRYTQTVGEMQRIVRLQREVRTRWITKEVRP